MYNSTIPEVFESSSVLSVHLLQSFISVVVMLLLLLSGDVETNPGPTTSKCVILYIMCSYRRLIALLTFITIKLKLLLEE